MKRTGILLYIIIGVFASVSAQPANMGKLSPWLRHLARTWNAGTAGQKTDGPARVSCGTVRLSQSVCAFVRIEEATEEVLARYDSELLSRVGGVCIARIPVARLAQMSCDPRVARIEARPVGEALCDSMAHHLNALPVYEGTGLPQAFTGKGVVVGLMDIGFDLTHPNFYDRSGQNYRIRCLWDMLSRDTVGSAFPVGRDFVGTESLLALAHSYDGFDETHGTHTLGIAAGSGHDSPYRGMAPESDICLVANATSNNAALIDSALYDRFTFATDALGFKYIFDYAQRVGKPCVASFSEGSGEDFWGYDQLYYEMLDGLLGPGRILVAAAGNNGFLKNWFCKPEGVASTGTFLYCDSRLLMSTVKSADPFLIRLVSYSTPADTLLVDTREVLRQPDSLLTCRLGGVDSVEIQAYPSCYNASETCYDLTFYAARDVGVVTPLSLEVLGNDAYVEFWRVNGSMVSNPLNPQLCAGENHHNIHSPSSSPRVISVGATTYRDSIQNRDGQWRHYWLGEHARRVPFSSMGPTLDGRVKPDVMAPGNNIISSYSSFYLESHPDADDIGWDVAHFDHNGRTYAWNSNSGTSMSCPAVAGAIALWLQAKPTLTPEEALDVIAHTSRQPDATLEYPNNEYGYGEIDVYRGLLYLLGADRIEAVSSRQTTAQMSVAGHSLHVRLPQMTAQPTVLRLYSLKGQLLQTAEWTAGQQEMTLQLPQLPAGVYAIQLDGDRAVAGSTLIRL